MRDTSGSGPGLALATPLNVASSRTSVRSSTRVAGVGRGVVAGAVVDQADRVADRVAGLAVDGGVGGLGQRQVAHRVGGRGRVARARVTRLARERVGDHVVALVGVRLHRDLVGHRQRLAGRDRCRDVDPVAGSVRGRGEPGVGGDRAGVEHRVVGHVGQVVEGVDRRGGGADVLEGQRVGEHLARADRGPVGRVDGLEVAQARSRACARCGRRLPGSRPRSPGCRRGCPRRGCRKPGRSACR